MQFFVNRGKRFTTIVCCSLDAVLSDVLHLDTDEYAVCGSRFVKVGCTLSENWIGNGSNVEALRRQVRIWTFRVSGSAKYVMQRGVGLPGSDATSVMLHVMRFLTTFP